MGEFKKKLFFVKWPEVQQNPQNGMCVQQSLSHLHEEALGPWLPIAKPSKRA